ncbi:hypothetical protein ABPG74_022594 [Tetrahymena malaccensis]
MNKHFQAILILKILISCYSLSIDIENYWFKISEDQSIIYKDLNTKVWMYTRFSDEGEINLQVKLKNFVGKQDEKDEYMIEEDNTKNRYLYVFSYKTAKYQQIKFDQMIKTQNNQEFDCEQIILQYGEQMTGYFQIDKNYVKYKDSQISQINQKFNPQDKLIKTVQNFQKTPYYFQYQENGINFIFWKNQVYKINFQIFQYDKNIVLAKENKLISLKLDGKSIQIQNSVELTSYNDKSKYGQIYIQGKVMLFGYFYKPVFNMFSNYLFFDYQTLSQNSQTNEIDKNVVFLAFYQDLIILKNQLLQISYDQKNQKVSSKTLNSALSQNDNKIPSQKNFLQILYGQILMFQETNSIRITSVETLVCQDGQHLNFQRIGDPVCQVNPSKCENASPENVCHCQNFNYQRSSKKCIKCDSPQIFDDWEDTCQNACEERQYYNGWSCSQCIPNCLVCKNDQSCIKCNYREGYYSDLDQNCSRCEISEYQILNQQQDGCTCQKGYYRMKQNTV